MKEFENQLLGAWLAAGLPGQANKNGGALIGCPSCKGLLDVANRVAVCGLCNWRGEGEPDQIARQAASLKAPQPKGDPSTAEFENQLFGAWRAVGLIAAPFGLTHRLAFACPACDLGKLEVADRLVSCDACEFTASGEAWEVAAKGKAAVNVEDSGTKGQAESSEGGAVPLSDPFAILDARRVRVEDRPEKPLEVVRLGGQAICTPGNITAISAQAKAGKSAALGGLLAAVMAAALKGDDECSPWEAADCLGFDATPLDDKALIHFDTEQSPYDAWRLVERAARRVGINALPSNVRSYRLIDVTPHQRRIFLKMEMERAAAECGGIHSVIVDGGADLIKNVNDIEESNGFVDELARLAVSFGCPVIVVIHENPAQPGQGGKTRGHFGSQLERKAESNLRLVKGSDGITEIYSEKCRSANIPQGRGVCFEWSDQAGMHVRVERVKMDKEEGKKQTETLARDAVFSGVVGLLSYSELVRSIMGAVGVQSRAAENRIKTWMSLGLIAKDGAGMYRKTI